MCVTSLWRSSCSFFTPFLPPSLFVAVLLLPPLPRDEFHFLLQHAYALLNSSESEGMCATILEAMALGVPVLARAIPGNEALVTHEQTGLLFASPAEFVDNALRLDSSEFQAKLVAGARDYITRNHLPEQELAAYQEVLMMLSAEAKQSSAE
eukprot:m.168768 g.168768  ORF g.168768 m.168768 type:complete len:152 (+) comp10357_c0_seq3:807-1262(+)